ncbi:NLR family CARD domain-containing protein 3-like [Colossoma macropomum]|uniref:NLR family CARD domain-containing protein 3-like n=1 Tax=Colossoma macropomum TaxID=42526 RepID=UPI001863D62A|nr:NLR family CARD domain-containing protein 3-like [Colossoma macropomum]
MFEELDDSWEAESSEEPDIPGSYCMFMKSEDSMENPPQFRHGLHPTLGPIHTERSPEPSCVSMKSDFSRELPLYFRDSNTKMSPIHTERSESSEPSCVSMKSDFSRELPIYFRDSYTKMSLIPTERSESPEPSCVSMKSDFSRELPLYFRGFYTKQSEKQDKAFNSEIINHLDSVFMDVEHKVISLVKTELKRFKKVLCSHYSACSKEEKKDEEDQSTFREGALKITLHVLNSMNQTGLAKILQTKLAPVCQKNFKIKLKTKYKRLNEGIVMQGHSKLISDIYTELYITAGESGEVNNEHEVRQIETAFRRLATQDTAIKCHDIFKGLPGEDELIRTVLTKGVAGIGKTVSVHKFILDWADGKANQDIQFIFPLPFRELNLLKEKKLSLMGLLHHFFTETKEFGSLDCADYKVLFIFDGLDECRLPLDFQKNESLCSATEATSLDVLLTNLIKGNLLPSALLWITSRPAAANQIPPECVDQVTEVRGFNDHQKEEYFRKRISDQSLAKRIITHIKSSRSLYIMCHLPVFCWISATVLERLLNEEEMQEIPKTLTQMFTHFLIFETKQKNLKYHGKYETDPQQARETILALGKLAFQELAKGNLIFYEDDLTECGINVKELAVYSGVCTQVFREEFGLFMGKVYCFVHLSIQEFLAALYVFLSFSIHRENPPGVKVQQTSDLADLLYEKTQTDLLKRAVDKAINSENGHLDLFVRFLLGLSVKSNQTLLQGLQSPLRSSSHSSEEVAQHIKKKIREKPAPEKSINLFYCLNELNDLSLMQEVQKYVHSKDHHSLSEVRLTPVQWSALVFALLNSEKELDEFKLSKYGKSDEYVLRLQPVIKASRKAELCNGDLTEKSCIALASALGSSTSSLRELNMSKNCLHDSGVKKLCFGLMNPHCKLETLKLIDCELTRKSCVYLASVLMSKSSNLKELALSCNELCDPGVKLLTDALRKPQCKLETLNLYNCKVTDEGCAYLASALRSNTSCLRELNLGRNELGESETQKLSAFLEDPSHKLKNLLL